MGEFRLQLEPLFGCPFVILISSCDDRTLSAYGAQAFSCADRGYSLPDNQRMPKKHDLDKEKYLQEFAERVEQAFVHKKIFGSIQDKASAIEVSKSFMADILNAKKLPSGWNMVNLAIKLGVGAEWLILGRGDMVPVMHEGLIDITKLSPEWQTIVKDEVSRVYVLAPEDYSDISNQSAIESQPAEPVSKNRRKQKSLPPPKRRPPTHLPSQD